MNSWGKAKEKEKQLVVLTRNSLDRWNIVISILSLLMERLEKKETLPKFILSKRLLKVHKPGNIYNTIDLLHKEGITQPLDREHSHDAFLVVSLAVLAKELDVWSEISQIRPLPKLQSYALKVIDQLLQEIETLINRPALDQSNLKNSRV